MKKLKSKYIVLSAPSGGGKTTIAKTLVSRHNQLKISVSATTRPKRPQEQEGVDYYFLTPQQFQKYIAENKFLEYEQVHGYFYGTLKEKVDQLVRQGYGVVFDIDVNGALSIKKHYPEAILIFVKPPSEEELIRRLKNRKSETEEAIRKRLERLPYEYQMSEKFDHIIVNDRLDDTIAQIEAIIFEDDN